MAFINILHRRRLGKEWTDIAPISGNDDILICGNIARTVNYEVHEGCRLAILESIQPETARASSDTSRDMSRDEVASGLIQA